MVCCVFKGRCRLPALGSCAESHQIALRRMPIVPGWLGAPCETSGEGSPSRRADAWSLWPRFFCPSPAFLTVGAGGVHVPWGVSTLRGKPTAGCESGALGASKGDLDPLPGYHDAAQDGPDAHPGTEPLRDLWGAGRRGAGDRRIQMVKEGEALKERQAFQLQRKVETGERTNSAPSLGLRCRRRS